METKLRSATKSLIWRITGVFILAIITYLFTRSWFQTSLITIIHHSIFLVVFYYHERIWLLVPQTKMLRRSLWKMLTYETFLGNIILGTITYLVTGDLKAMTSVTLTYIGIKHLCYVLNEYAWKKKERD